MARFIVTSGSHFQPFTYNELVEPLMQMTEAQNNAQEAYDHISMETNALENYISQNPEDERARAMYDNYKSKLTALQNNLWNNGYSGQTARDLSAARAGYAGDITRLATAIKNRQDRSKEYWDLRHKNPDMVAGDDPGASGLDNYLDDDQYGQNYFNYSGDQFTKEVATDAQARAAELQNTSIAKDPKAVGYLERIDREGYTAQEVSDANNAVEAILMGGADRDAVMANMELPQRILTETLLSHMSATGAQQYSTDEAGNRTGNLSEGEYRRLLEYGKAGLAHAIGKTKVDYMTDQQYAYDKQVAMENLRFQHQRQAAAENFQYQAALAGLKNGRGSGSGSGSDDDAEIINNDSNTKQVIGNRKAAEKQIKNWFGEDTLKFTKGGAEIHNGAEASDFIYQHDMRAAIAEKIGLDVGRDPRRNPDNRVTGELTLNGTNYEVRVIPGRRKDNDYVQVRKKGVYSNDEDGWKNQNKLTKIYNDAREIYLSNINYYKQNEPEIYAMATVNPDKQYDIYNEEGFSSSRMPLSAFIDRYYDKPRNREHTDVKHTYIALGTEKGIDGGNYIGQLNEYLAPNIHEGEGKHREWKDYKGQPAHIHKYSWDDDAPERKSVVNADKIFTFDKNHNINNINSVAINENALKNGYIIVGTSTNGDQLFTIGIDMINSDQIKGLFEQAQEDFDANERNPHKTKEQRDATREGIINRLASEIRSKIYNSHLKGPGNTTKEDNN